MAALYYTLMAIALYVFADWLLQRLEIAAGRRFVYRSAYFFFILLATALATFATIRYFGTADALANRG